MTALRSLLARTASAAALAAVGTGLLTSTASAQTRTWDLGDGTTPGACTQIVAGGTNNVGNIYGCSEQPSGTTTSLYVSARTTSDLTAAGTFSASAITPQGASGVGVGSAAEGGQYASSINGSHALDNNAGGGADMLLFQFLDGAQVLKQVTLGWTGADADFQVLRWGGAGAPGSSMTVGSALGAGWQLVSTVAGMGAATYNVNAAGLASSYWAVTAYNPGWGTSVGFTADGTADQFKVRSLTAGAPTNVVPEPSTYALLGTGLAGLAAAARRRRAALGA